MRKREVILTSDVLFRLEKLRVYLRPRFNFGNAEGKKISLSNTVFMEPYSRVHEASFSWDGGLQIGAFSYVSPNSTLHNCKIGRYSSIASNVQIMGANHPMDRFTTSTWTYGNQIKKIVHDDFSISIHQDRELPPLAVTIISHDVWIAQNVLLKSGVKINIGSVVAAGSVVIKDVPPYAIVGGNPARVIRYRFDSKTIEELLNSRWWNLSPKNLAEIKSISPNDLLSNLQEHKQENIDWQPGFYDVAAIIENENDVFCDKNNLIEI